MLIDNEAKNDEDEDLKNWDKLDEWGATENYLNQLESIQNNSKSDICSNLARMDASNGLESQTIPISMIKPNQFGEKDYTCDTLSFPEINEKSDVGSLDEMKDSYVPVLVGSANGSNDFMV